MTDVSVDSRTHLHRGITPIGNTLIGCERFQVGVIDPELSEEDNMAWSQAVEQILTDDTQGSMLSKLKQVKVFFSTPTSIDNAIDESVGAQWNPSLIFLISN